jgi:RNA-directed DNA polymerase
MFGLELHPDKTRRIEFGRFAEENRKHRGEGKPETFDFLGFTNYAWQEVFGHVTDHYPSYNGNGLAVHDKRS